MNNLLYKKCSALMETLANMTDANGQLTVRADLVERMTKVWNELAAAFKITANHTEHFEQIFRLLEEKMKRIEQLHVFSLPTPDLKYFAVDIFPSLRVLRLEMCPPSTIKGIYNMRNVLKTLVMTNSGITNMSRALAPFKKRILRLLSPMIFPDAGFTIPRQYLWSNLLTLKLSNCGISKIDESMHFFPSIEYLDLSHNTITHVIHLQDCIDLKFLNLSHNRIRVLSNLERVVGSVTTIILSNNDIESLDGIDRILSLEKLVVADNRINDYAEIQLLCKLPNLEAVRLVGNPLADSQQSQGHYRMRVFRAFIADGSVMRSDRPFPVLDGVPMTIKERRFFKRIMFRSATDKDATFSHFDANLLSSTDVLLDQELGGDWGNMDFIEDDDTGFGDIYAPGAEGEQANFSFVSDGPAIPSPLTKPGASSGGVGELSSPAVALKGTFANLRRSASPLPGSRTMSTVSSNTNTNSLSGIAGPRGTRMSMDSTRSSPLISPLMGSRASVSGRTASTALAPSFYSPNSAGGTRMSFYNTRSNSNSGDPSRASFMSSANPNAGPIGISSPSKRMALRFIQANNAAQQRAGDGNHGVPSSSSLSSLRVKRKIQIANPNNQEVYPDLAEVEQSMQEIRERMRLEALALAKERMLEKQRMSPFACEGVSRSLESPGNSYHANKMGSYESKISDGLERASTVSDSSRSDSPVNAPISTMDDLVRRVGVDHVVGSPEETTSSLLMRGLDAAKFAARDDILGMSRITPTEEQARRFSFSSDGESVQTSLQTSNHSSVSNLPSAAFSYEANSGKRMAALISPAAPQVHRKTDESAAEYHGDSAYSSHNNLESIAELPSESARSSFNYKNDMRPSLSLGTRPTYANVAASPRGSEMLRPSDVRNVGIAGNAAESQAYEEVPSMLNTYVGDPDYRNLSVTENMDLYMKEQVFNIKRPSGISPYMKEAASTDSMKGIAVDASDALPSPFIKTAYRYEKFIAVFCEKIIDITYMQPTESGRNASGTTPASPPRMNKNRRDQLPRADEEAAAALEETRYLVLTDTCLYLVMTEFPAQATFSDAPVPTVLRAHKLYSLCNCTIFFGFQRCILGFVDENQYKDLIYDNLAEQAEMTTGNSVTGGAAAKPELVLRGEKVLYQYMVLTREKTRTYPLITRINKAANLQRSAFLPIPLSNVHIDNKDFQLVEKVMHCTLTLGGDHDIVHYQMAYQVWRKRPGVKLPRTIILTQTLLILCSEELNRPDIHLDVIDTAGLADVQKIYMDDNPLYVTFVLKSNALFAKTRKWRMCTDSRATSTRLQEECRRACAEQGNPV